MDKMQNFVVGDIVTPPSPATSGTSVTVDSGSYFPDPSTFGEYNIVLWDKEQGQPNLSNCEIVRVTAKTTDDDNAILTITRAQESTTAKEVTTGWRAYLSPTKKYFDDLKTYIDSHSGGMSWVEKSTTYTTQAGEGVLANTSGGAWTLTLPSTPSVGDFIGVSDSNSTFNTNNLTIARNSSKIMGEEEDLVVDLKDASFQLIYTGSATGWKLDTNLSMPEVDPIDIGYKSLVSNVMDMTVNRGGRFAQTQSSNTTYTASSSSGDVWILKINCTGDSTATFTSMTIVGGTTSNTLSCVSGNVYSIIFENYNSTITGRVL